MADDSQATALAIRTPSWDGVVLICKDCGKRSNGPRTLSSKALVKAARKVVGARRPRPRVLSTTCLGLCPKRAIAVASVRATATRLVALRSKRELAVALTAMRDEPTPDDAASARTS